MKEVGTVSLLFFMLCYLLEWFLLYNREVISRSTLKNTISKTE